MFAWLVAAVVYGCRFSGSLLVTLRSDACATAVCTDTCCRCRRMPGCVCSQLLLISCVMLWGWSLILDAVRLLSCFRRQGTANVLIGGRVLAAASSSRLDSFFKIQLHLRQTRHSVVLHKGHPCQKSKVATLASPKARSCGRFIVAFLPPRSAPCVSLTRRCTVLSVCCDLQQQHPCRHLRLIQWQC